MKEIIVFVCGIAIGIMALHFWVAKVPSDNGDKYINSQNLISEIQSNLDNLEKSE